jgi:protein TonB
MAAVGEPLGSVSPAKRWLRRLLLALAMLGVVGTVIWAGVGLSHRPTTPERQVARIMILPDTPPPPPPPPPPEQKPQPQEMLKQAVETPKIQTPPQPEPLKMEGQAGQGPSPFAAGQVTHEYIGGDTGDGSRYSPYIARLGERIQTELSRRRLHVNNLKLFVWLASDGSIQHYTLQGGDSDAQRGVSAAIHDINGGAEAPLANMPMPIGLEIN